MDQLKLFAAQESLKEPSPLDDTKNHRLVFHSALDAKAAHQLSTLFLKKLKKIDPNARASIEELMSTGPWLDMPFLVVDVETTGLDRNQHRVIEVAWALFHNQEVVFSESRLCAIEGPLPEEIVALTGIRDDMLKDQPEFAHHIEGLLKAMNKAAFVVAYNANFDRLFLEAEFARAERLLPQKHWIDPCVFIREVDRYQKGKKLTDAAARWGVKLNNAHRALADALACGHLLYKLSSHLNAYTLPELIVTQQKWQAEQEKSYQAYLARKPAR